MRKHMRRRLRARRDPADRAPRPPRHPVAFAVGILIVLAIAGVTGVAAWSLYSDYTWRSSARDAAAGVEEAITSYSVRDDSLPQPVDAVASAPGPDQATLDDLPYADDLPQGVTRIRVTEGGALSVLTSTEALCSGRTLNMTAPGKASSGSFRCGDALVPQAVSALTASPLDSSVLLEWTRPPTPVEDYSVTVSGDDGATWAPYDDGVTSVPRDIVRPLANGREYLFRVTARNLVGESAPVMTRASPFTAPGPPTNVHASGGFGAVVSWSPPADDGGRPVTGYLVTGDPTGSCSAPSTSTRCEVPDLPAAPGYTFIVRALNEAGAGTPSLPTPNAVAVYSTPGRAVALAADPGDRVVLLSWTPPLRDGNTAITDYRVEYRAAGQDAWNELVDSPSAETTRTVSGLVNGTEYEFRVFAVNAVGTSEPPLSPAFQTPATIPGPVPTLELVEGNASAALSWTAPVDDGESPVTDYAIQFRPAGGAWQNFNHPVGIEVNRDVTGLENGTRYAFRVAALNRMGQGPWSKRALGTPVGPPGPVVEPESVGSLTAIELTWKPPENDGGRPIRGYRVEYKLSSSDTWLRVPRVPSDQTTVTVEDLEGGEAYDFRIVAVTRAGFGPSTPGSADRPTLAGVIADETPPAPEGFTAIAGDRSVTLRWEESPAGRKSPIAAYTVTGDPAGTCTTKRLTCVIRGLTNGQRYTFTVSAANENIIGPESRTVRATPRVFNAAVGGVESTYTRAGRTYRVHTITSTSTFTVTSSAQPFSVLVVGGGGGSRLLADGRLAVGGGGGIIDARRTTLAVGVLNVVVGAGGPPGAAGGLSSMDGVGAAPAGTPGSATATEFSPTTRSSITGRPTTYGGTGTLTSGPGADGRGVGGGGPAANRGGNGIVIIRYEVGG